MEGKVLQTHLEQKLSAQAREISIMQKCLGNRNKILDALWYVWCDGTCQGVRRGVPEITESIVKGANWFPGPLNAQVVWHVEHQAMRLKSKLHNGKDTGYEWPWPWYYRFWYGAYWRWRSFRWHCMKVFPNFPDV